jgi:transposase
VVRRAQAFLWLDQGEHPIVVAQRLAVTRESVYAWARRLRLGGANSLTHRLTGQSRSGRPTGKRQAVQQMVQKVMNTDPTQFSYQAEGWTLALLRHQTWR